MKDLRMVDLESREGMAFGVKEGIGTLVGGGILALIGLYAYGKVGHSIRLYEGTAINSTTACTGAWNGTVCVGGSLTSIPVEDATMTAVKGNILSGFDTMSIVFIIIGIATFVGLLFLVFQ